MTQVLRAAAAAAVLALLGCGKGDSSTADAPSKPAGGVISGKVTFADGRPIDTPGADLTINVFGVSTAGEKVSYSPAIKPDGTYAQKAVPGSYRFETRGQVKVPFNGETVLMPLEPVGTAWSKDRDVADGIVQDWVWKPIGQVLDRPNEPNNHTSWYGGCVKPTPSMWRNDKNVAVPPLADGTKLTFTLTPKGKTIDGRDAKPLTLERKIDTGKREFDQLYDLPLAEYDLTGTVTRPDGTSKPMLFEVKYATFAPTQPIKFASSYTGFWPVNVSFLTD